MNLETKIIKPKLGLLELSRESFLFLSKPVEYEWNKTAGAWPV